MTFNAVMDASQKYRENMEKEYPNDTFDSSDLEIAFREGQLWFKDNLWHKPEEQPEGHTVILFECVILGTRSFYTQNIIFKEDYKRYLTNNYEVRRWCYVNDLI